MTDLHSQPEMDALLKLISPFTKQSELATLTFEKLDLNTFINLVNRHHVHWHVNNSLTKYSIPIPASLRDTLFNKLTANMKQALSNIKELKRLSVLFEEAGIDFMPLKGVVLGQFLYGDPLKRHAGDLDLFFCESDVQRVSDILIKNGYMRIIPASEPNKTQWRHIYHFWKHLVFRHKESGRSLELHFRFVSQPQRFDFDWNSTPTQTVELDGVKFKLLTPEYLFLFLVKHGGWHGWSSLHWLLDVAMMLSAENSIVLKPVLEKATTSDADKWVQFALALLQDLFDYKTDNVSTISHHNRTTINRLARYSNNAIFSFTKYSFRTNINHVTYHLSCINKFSEIKYVIDGYVMDTQDWDRIKLPNSLFFLYYVLRPFTRILRLLKVFRNYHE